MQTVTDVEHQMQITGGRPVQVIRPVVGGEIVLMVLDQGGIMAFVLFVKVVQNL